MKFIAVVVFVALCSLVSARSWFERDQVAAEKCDTCKQFFTDIKESFASEETQGKVDKYIKMHVCMHLPGDSLKKVCESIYTVLVPLVMNAVASVVISKKEI